MSTDSQIVANACQHIDSKHPELKWTCVEEYNTNYPSEFILNIMKEDLNLAVTISFVPDTNWSYSLVLYHKEERIIEETNLILSSFDTGTLTATLDGLIKIYFTQYNYLKV